MRHLLGGYPWPTCALVVRGTMDASSRIQAAVQALKSNAAQLAAGMAAAERHRILEHVHEFARDLIMQLNVLSLAVAPAAPP